MPEYNLSDAQWCVLDLLMRSREKGVHSLNRMEMLSSGILPTGAAMKLTWAALIMPPRLVKWTGKHDFAITDEGVSLYKLRFGNGADPKPTEIADHVICLPDMTRRVQ
jgi:hypothetical protein